MQSEESAPEQCVSMDADMDTQVTPASSMSCNIEPSEHDEELYIHIVQQHVARGQGSLACSQSPCATIRYTNCVC